IVRVSLLLSISHLFFINDTAPTETYTLSLHDALPISQRAPRAPPRRRPGCRTGRAGADSRRRHGRRCRRVARARERARRSGAARSEEHTSELQSQSNLVCRLLLEKKKNKKNESDKPNQ